MSAALPAHGPAYGHLADHAKGAFASLIVLPILCTVAVAGLFAGRIASGNKIFACHWMILAALIIFHGYCVVGFLSIFLGGTGSHIDQLGSKDLENSFKLSFALEMPYPVSMGLLKVSILIMLAQIFATRKFRIVAFTVMGLAVAWSIMTILIGFLLCTPLEFNWNTSIPGGHCGNQNDAYAAVSAIDILVDLLIIVLPLPSIWHLQTATGTKISLTFLFSLGLLTIGITGARMNSLLNASFADYSYSVADILLWTTVEWGIAIIVTCGPGLKPALHFLLPRRLLSLASRKQTVQCSCSPNTQRSCGHCATYANGYGNDAVSRNNSYITTSGQPLCTPTGIFAPDNKGLLNMAEPALHLKHYENGASSSAEEDNDEAAFRVYNIV